MNKIRHFAWSWLSCLLVVLAGCGTSEQSAGEPSRPPLTENEAIRTVIEARNNDSDHFPLIPGTTKFVDEAGGKLGMALNVEWTTAVTRTEQNHFVVKLVKDWNVTISDREVVSSWTYEVNEQGAALVESEIQDHKVALIKSGIAAK
ncbi:hypothetical protein [Paenibacillus soyae]|uniref:DUF3221 domain-containing protein n=1 Tax=Paenibacillus soyae TaxID=2969249 RepID=A0A9X2MME8_9BACL|nr:hypothetical protein [Paenibacillus soyae]MCR2802742.1 hypothetical protein [Paenibacillus soyae]